MSKPIPLTPGRLAQYRSACDPADPNSERRFGGYVEHIRDLLAHIDSITYEPNSGGLEPEWFE